MVQNNPYGAQPPQNNYPGQQYQANTMPPPPPMMSPQQGGMGAAPPMQGAPPMPNQMGQQQQPPPLPEWWNTGIPSWQNMTMGQQKSPLLEFIGTLLKVEPEQNNFGRVVINMTFGSVQVVDSEIVYTDSEAVLGVNYSESWNSGFGKLGRSFEQMLQMDPKTFTMKDLIGYSFRMKRTPNETFGQNRVTGEPMQGDVWRCTQVMSGPGVAPQQQAQQQPVAQQPPPPPQPIPTQQPAAMAPIPPATPVVAEAPSTKELEDRALSMANGKTEGDFFNAVMVDPVLKENQEFISRVVNRQFLAEMIGNGRLIVNADGTHSVQAT